MPDLETRIAEWRHQMSAGGIRNPQVLDELENHLREDIERQMRSGLDMPRAFEAAAEKIGDARALKSEFSKAEPPKQSIGRYLARIIPLMSVWFLSAEILNPIERSLALGFVVAAALALYPGRFPFRQRVLRALQNTRGAAVIKFASLFVVVWPLVAIGNASGIFHSRIGNSMEMAIWDFYAAWCVVILAICYLYQRGGDPFDPLTATPWSFTARQSFEIARAEAFGFHHDFIGTEHLLLGLLKSESAVVPGILNRLGVNEHAIRSEIRKFVDIGPAHEVPAAIPLTPRARKALQLAAEEAKARYHSAPGAEHIFLGLLLEGSGVAALALKSLGVRIEKVREIISNE